MHIVQHSAAFVCLLLQRSGAAGSSESYPGRFLPAGAQSVRRAAHDTLHPGPDGFNRYAAVSTQL